MTAPFAFDLDAIQALPPEERKQEMARIAAFQREVEKNPLWSFVPHKGDEGQSTWGQLGFLSIETWMGAYVAGNRAGKTHVGAVDLLIQVLGAEWLPPWLRQFKRWEVPGDFQGRVVGVDLPNWLEKVMIPKLRLLTPPGALWKGEFDKAYNDRKRMLRFADGSWVDFLCFRGDQRALMADGVWRRVDELRAGDMVQTRHGPRKVLRSVSYSEGPLYKVTTRGGAEITATPNHPHMTTEGWKRTDELTVGDILDVRVGDTGGRATLEEWELGWMAVLIGDGLISGSQRTPQFSAHSQSPLLNELPPLPVGYKLRWRTSKRPGDCETIYLVKKGRGHGSVINQMLKREGLWGCRAHDKFIPDSVFREPKERRARFLRWLWATDGTVSTQFKRAVYTTCSRRLAHDVKFMLWSLGLRAAVFEHEAQPSGFRKTPGTMFMVRISGSQFGKFCEMVGRAGEVYAPVEPGRHHKAESRKAGRVRKIEYVGKEPVYCVEVDEVHELIVEGVVTSNTHDMDIDAYAGTSMHYIWMDEEPPGSLGKQQFEESLTRLTDTNGDIRFTLTPLLGLSWVYNELTDDNGEPRVDDEVQVVTGAMDHNPHTSAEAKARLKERWKKSDALTLVARTEGRWVHFAGLIFDEYRDAPPIVIGDRPIPRKDEQAKPSVPIYAAIDPGINHPAGLVFFWVDEEDVAEVFYAQKYSDLTVKEHAELYWSVLAQFDFKPRWTVIDPSAQNRNPQTGRSLQWAYQEEGIYTMLGQNSRELGYNEIKNRLRTGRLKLHAQNAAPLRDEFLKYRWKPQRGKSEDAAKPEPIKINDDVIDPLRYGLVSLPQKAKPQDEEDHMDPRARLAREHLARLSKRKKTRIGSVRG